MILIIGGSGSGKSACAEEYAAALSEDSRRYYIATMRVNNNEGQAKVERHKRMRRDKGFNTIEQPVAIEKVMDIIGLSRLLRVQRCWNACPIWLLMKCFPVQHRNRERK